MLRSPYLWEMQWGAMVRLNEGSSMVIPETPAINAENTLQDHGQGAGEALNIHGTLYENKCRWRGRIFEKY